MASHSAPSVSVVIPLFNEEESLQELSQQLRAVLEPFTSGQFEILFIDDGSTDSSLEILRRLHSADKRFKIISFRRNQGKSAGLAVGFAKAEGEFVITMDADLQDDPAEIPSLIEKLKEGFDLVSGWKKVRHDPLEKTLPSRLFNAVTSSMSGISLHDFNCGLKAYRKEVVKSVRVYGEMHRYIPALAHWEGFRVTELPVQHRARKYGHSKFGASRYVKGVLDLLTILFTTRYVKRPLHVFGAIGMVLGLLGTCIDGWLTIEWFLGLTSLSNRPLALLGVLLIIVGVQFVSMGLLAELIVKNSIYSFDQHNYPVKEEWL
jgi:glycosyltransferase involved in cell wall biosynthesis